MDETEATAGPNSLLRLAFAPEGEHKSTCVNALLRALFRTMKYVTAASDRGHAKIRRYREAPRGPTWGGQIEGETARKLPLHQRQKGPAATALSH
jgi:hypothetical protein